MRITCLALELALPDCHSLKEKRSRLKPLLARLQRECAVSAAETDLQDVHHRALIACVVVSNDAVHNRQVLERTLRLVEQFTQAGEVVGHSIEDVL